MLFDILRKLKPFDDSLEGTERELWSILSEFTSQVVFNRMLINLFILVK